MAKPIHPPEPSWGVRINTERWHEPRQRQGRPQGCPTWAQWIDIEHFCRRGVVVWDNALQQLEHLSAERAIKMLERLRADSAWKSDGIVITRPTTYVHYPERPRVKRSRQKGVKSEAKQPAEEINATYESVDEERIRLRDQAALDFVGLLEANETQLRQMVEEDRQHQGEVLSKVYSHIFAIAHDGESRQLNISARVMPWVYDETSRIWTCGRPPYRATVSSTKDNWLWQACIEQPDRLKHFGPSFVKLEEALAWAEQELSEAQAITEEAVHPEQSDH